MTQSVTESAAPRPRVGSEKRPIVVIGGGFSGTMAAIELARTMPPDQPIVLCERGTAFGIGVAYSTALSAHLLNVRATNMSAFASDSAHFAAWLDGEGDAAKAECNRTEAGVFASRALYGQYLKSILYDALREGGHPVQVRLLPDEIVDCSRGGDGFELVSGSGRRYQARAVVLATGHVPPAPSPDRRYVTNPWTPDATQGLDRTRPVLVLGTGLTMVDTVLSLRQSGFDGQIIALSRRGALAQVHRATAPWPTPSLTAAERGSVRLLMRRLRAEANLAGAQGSDWRSVIDSIRPITTEIWGGWTDGERRRFLRHARRWWDIHRHRLAPSNASAIEASIADGSLRVLAGRVSAMKFDRDGVSVAYQALDGQTDELSVQRVIAATGFESAVRTRDKFIQRLIDKGLVRLDGLGFGIEVTRDLAIVGGDGNPAGNFWALGPIVRGVFWECIAVPDIRQQAERVGRLAAAALYPVA